MGPLLTVVVCLVLLGALLLVAKASIQRPEDDDCGGCFQRERESFNINDFRQ